MKLLLSALATLLASSAIASNTDLAPGRIPGPGHIDTIVHANDTDVYEVDFKGGAPAIITVDGDGDTDLDLYVYDATGRVVVKDIDFTDDCVAVFTPRRTGTFRVEVVNLGDVYNAYTMQTN